MSVKDIHTFTYYFVDFELRSHYYQYRPSGGAIPVPQISTRIYGGISGIIPAEISARFPRGNEGEMKGNFLFGYVRLLSLWNPWGYFHVEISLMLPSKI